MTDLLLRGLTRRWRADSDPLDEAALLAAAVRAGRVTSKQADLLAWVGHPAAIAVRGDPAAPAGPHAWALGLERWGKRVCDRAAVACASVAVERLARVGGARVEERTLLDALERWVDHPCPACLEEVGAAASAAAQAPYPRNARVTEVVARAAAVVRAGRLRRRVAAAAATVTLASTVLDEAEVRVAVRRAIVAATWPEGAD